MNRCLSCAIFSLALMSGVNAATASSLRLCWDQYDPVEVVDFWDGITVEDVDDCIMDIDIEGALSTTGRTPLHDAITHSAVPEILEALFSRDGVNPNLRLEDGTTPLHYLVENEGGIAYLEQALDIMVANGALLDARDLEGMTLLLMSAEQGKTDLLKLLIDKGADIDARNLSGEGVMDLALQNGPVEAVKALLDAGIGLESATYSLVTALQSEDPEVGVFVVENMDVIERRTNSTVTAAHIVARYGSAAAMQALKDRGARLNIGYQTERPLHWAAQHNWAPEIIGLIVDGNDPEQVNAKTRLGLTPIMLAILHNPNPEVAQVLADLGADLTVRTPDGKSLYDLLDDREMNPEFKSMKSTQLYWDIHEARF